MKPVLQEKPETLAQSFNRLTSMFTGFGLKNAIAVADMDRTPDNLYKAASEVFNVVREDAWFVLGNEDLWEQSVKKMQSMLEEAANGNHARAALMAGLLHTREWSIGGATVTSYSPDFKTAETQTISGEPVIERDLSKALGWFEKSAALGNEEAAKYAGRAREELAAQNRPRPFAI